STGLAFWRKFTNTPTFSDGWNHWALTAGGVVTWTGSSIDPPASAVPPQPPVPVAPAVPPAELPFAVCAIADGLRNNALIVAGPGVLDACINIKTYLVAHTAREWTIIDNTRRDKYFGAF